MLPLLGVLLVLFELLAASIYQACGSIVAIALVEAAWLARIAAATLPIRIMLRWRMRFSAAGAARGLTSDQRARGSRVSNAIIARDGSRSADSFTLDEVFGRHKPIPTESAKHSRRIKSEEQQPTTPTRRRAV